MGALCAFRYLAGRVQITLIAGGNSTFASKCKLFVGMVTRAHQKCRTSVFLMDSLESRSFEHWRARLTLELWEKKVVYRVPVVSRQPGATQLRRQARAPARVEEEEAFEVIPG
jgi:hypothetical protein